jgi:hypothetical protein
VWREVTEYFITPRAILTGIFERMETIARSRAWVATALLVAACGGGGGGNSSPPPSTNPPPTGLFSDPVSYSSAANASLPNAAELTSVTHHQLTVNGTVLNYTATVGHMSALSASQAPQASFFYVAYTLDGAAPATRPVTFFYNGGPGSATVWLHLGSFGPKRLDTGEPNMSGTPPYPLVDNAESMLDLTDLVFVDAVGTGFSEAIAPNNNLSFWGVDADAAVFRDFVMRYATVNNRATCRSRRSRSRCPGPAACATSIARSSDRPSARSR